MKINMLFAFVAALMVALLSSCQTIPPDGSQGANTGLGNLLASFRPEITEDGCLLGTFSQGGHTYGAGKCVDNRFVVQWVTVNDKTGPVMFRYTRYPEGHVDVPEGRKEFSYSQGNGWVAWTRESGIEVGWIPARLPATDAAMIPHGIN